MKNILPVFFIFVLFLWFSPRALATTTIYATDFSADPEWTTDQPGNFYWDEPAGALFVRSENKGPIGVMPNRYFYTRTAIDPTLPFSFSWDMLPVDTGDRAWIPFGLFDSALSRAVNTVHLATYTDGLAANIITKLGSNRGSGHYGPDTSLLPGVWYHNEIVYNKQSNRVNLTVVKRETGEEILRISRPVEDDPFSHGMVNLGVSNYPYSDTLYPDSAYEAYIDNVVLDGSATGTPPVAECCSGVAFIPGLQATRLRLDDNRLWEPNRIMDVGNLNLDDDGNSIHSGIVTDGIIDEAFGFNIYKKFIVFMDDLVGDGAIPEWKPFPYDWRFSVEDAANEMYDELILLAERSPTGKTTIITHSNGGLIAKALITRLEAEGKVDLVDRLIMVAAPQLGTPKALASLLHGDEQEIPSKLGFVLSKRTARTLAENMPSAYSLLPSEKYFTDVFDPVVEFTDDVANIYDFQSLYGSSVESRGEMDRFLLGDGGARVEPDHDDTDTPNVLDAVLLAKATSTQEAQDAWTPPFGIEIIQIAGWGLDTIRGIRYDDCDIPFCPDTLNHLDRELLLAHDGDGTVVTPSAVAVEGAETYYVNLRKHNQELLFLRRNRDHADIFEVESLWEIIHQLFIGDIQFFPENITDIKPIPTDDDKKLRFRVHSPVSLDLYDADGNHTGRISNSDPDSDLERVEQELPNSYYTEFGETKYAGADTFATTTVVLTGLDIGTFTFEVDEVLGDEVVASSVFADIPVITGAVVTADIRHVGSSVILRIDMDGDGEVEATVGPGEEISTENLFAILRTLIEDVELSPGQNRKITEVTDTLEHALYQAYGNEIATRTVMGNAFSHLTRSFDELQQKGLISPEELHELIHIIEQIKLSVVT